MTQPQGTAHIKRDAPGAPGVGVVALDICKDAFSSSRLGHYYSALVMLKASPPLGEWTPTAKTIISTDKHEASYQGLLILGLSHRP